MKRLRLRFRGSGKVVAVFNHGRIYRLPIDGTALTARLLDGIERFVAAERK